MSCLASWFDEKTVKIVNIRQLVGLKISSSHNYRTVLYLATCRTYLPAAVYGVAADSWCRRCGVSITVVWRADRRGSEGPTVVRCPGPTSPLIRARNMLQ